MLTLGLAGALAGALAPGAAAQGPGRAYELISPIDKNLGDVLRVPPAADDGSTIPFATTAALDDAAGAQNASYTVARRTATGWMLADANPASLEPPQTLQPSTTIANQFSGDFSAVLVLAAAAFDAGDRDGQRGDLYRIAAGSGAATWLSHGATVPDSAGLTVSLVWASPDLDHVVFSATGTPQLLPGAGSRALYERIGDELRLVGYPPGSATPAANVLAVASNRDRSGLQTVGASGTAVAHGGARPVSDDGRRIFFAAGTGIGAAQLHLREDGVRTLPVSVSERTGSEGTLANARFIAANPQGDVAYFTSATQLTDDAQVGINIYRFSRLEEPGQRLQLITSQGGTISTAIASADGRHLYFVSTAALTAEATAGQRNAYHWTDGQLTLVATVGPDAPGADGAIARVSRDGSYAAITSSSSIADAPNDDHAALYLYDAGSDALSCASCRPDGTPSGGPANLEDRPVGTISPQLSAPRNLADDGRLYFASADRLLPDDQTDAADVYEYDDGAVSLLSSGTSAYDSYVADNSDDGRSVFFTTRAGLLPQDTDNGVLDLYVARTGGGFPPPEPPPTPCESDACQGLVPPPPSLLAPNSGVTGPSGNAVPSPATPRDIQLLRLSAPAKRRLAHDGASTLPVRISGGGTIVVRATGRLAGRMRTLGSTTRAVEQTGPVTARVRLELSAAARRALRRGRSLRIRIEVRVRGAAERDHTTLTLKRASR